MHRKSPSRYIIFYDFGIRSIKITFKETDNDNDEDIGAIILWE